jgi:hypothetical protein
MDFEAQKIYANIYEDVGLWRLNPCRIKAVTTQNLRRARMDGYMIGTHNRGISHPELPAQQRNILWEAVQMHTIHSAQQRKADVVKTG